MKLPFVTNGLLEKLRNEASFCITRFGHDNSWLDGLIPGKLAIAESGQIVDPPPILEFSGKDVARYDAENAKRIFLWLQHLKPSIAMEERLWAYLTHRVFQSYMLARWPLENDRVYHRRYLFEGKSFAALSRNGIARLWWAGHLTFDESRKNPFELTEQLFVRQDVHVALLERSLGKSRRIRTAVLEYLSQNSSWLSDAAFGARIQGLVKELNLRGGVLVLDSLAIPELKELLEEIGQRVRLASE